MEQHYKLDRVRELAGGDDDFVKALAEAFLEEVPEDASRLNVAVAEKDYFTTYQAAHKMKPTIDLFELGVLQELIEVQDWGKFEKNGEDVSTQLQKVLTAVKQATAEIKSDFNL
jgi:HPt (histidine-containing phosphotransfer) domain-containing protein